MLLLPRYFQVYTPLEWKLTDIVCEFLNRLKFLGCFTETPRQIAPPHMFSAAREAILGRLVGSASVLPNPTGNTPKRDGFGMQTVNPPSPHEWGVGSKVLRIPRPLKTQQVRAAARLRLAAVLLPLVSPHPAARCVS